ncbi:MAG: EAL domain-containing response regulator, partial [Gammaproteobacteria bacterium]|nr:EAL domain-containing response regulator [Gammaproteobacteria bacterium]
RRTPSMQASQDIEDLRVLLVDDDPRTLRLLSFLLDTIGVSETYTAADGLEALSYLDNTSERPDVILTDLNMPGLDGVEFLRHLSMRSISSRIVLISGENKRILDTAKTLAQVHDLSFIGTLQKPITQKALQKILRKCLAFGAQTRSRDSGPITEQELVDGLIKRDGEPLQTVYQPTVSMKTGAPVGVEALVRWTHDKSGVLGPMCFIPLAERLGHVKFLTDVVTRRVMAEAAFWQNSGLDLRVSINLSVTVLKCLDLPEFVIATAESTGLDPSKLTLEITESHLMDDFKESLETLARLRLKGVWLSIDDFGTGYSSMEQLKRVPFNEVKIDRCFVTGAVHDVETRAILESTIELGQRLGLVVVAEGVESREDWDLLESLGCDVAQGYFISRPLDAGALPAWVRNWNTAGLPTA